MNSLVSSGQTSERLHQDIVKGIQSGELTVGMRLPTERELAQQYGIGRSTVRRALATLEQEGYLSRTVGRGTFITQPEVRTESKSAGAESIFDVSPADLIKARLVLEPSIMEIVATKATSADLERMQLCLDKCEHATSVNDYDHWDGELHHTIANATHNAFIINVFNIAHEYRHQSEWGKLKVRSVTPPRRKIYQKDHHAIVEALVDRDGARARAAMERHLRNVSRFLLGE